MENGINIETSNNPFCRHSGLPGIVPCQNVVKHYDSGQAGMTSFLQLHQLFIIAITGESTAFREKPRFYPTLIRLYPWQR
jgi:hypothetical protein